MLNRPCANQALVDFYLNTGYYLIVIYNLIVAVASFGWILVAARRLLKQSIVQTSPVVFLMFSLFFAMLHQITYFGFKGLVLYDTYNTASPCELYHKAFDCRFITIGQTAGNWGLVLIQSAMSLDRILLLIFPNFYPKLKSAPAIFLSIVMTIVSFSVFFILTSDDDLDDYVTSCGYYPPKSSSKFNFSLTVSFCITFPNFFMDWIALKFYIRRNNRQKSTYDIKKRYDAYISLQSTRAIYSLSLTHFVAMSLYSGLLWGLAQLKPLMLEPTYAINLAFIYATPYACLILPIVICSTLNNIQKIRSISISDLVNRKEDQDQYMSRLQASWN